MLPNFLLVNNPAAETFYGNLNEAQRDIGKQYKAYEMNSNVYKLNQMLLTNKELALLTYKAEDELMNSIMFSFELKEELTLYKGTSKQRIDEFIKDGVYQNREWLSTALDFNTVARFLTYDDDNVLLIIKLDENFTGCPLQWNEEEVDEKEIILPRDSEFRIINEFRLNHGRFDEIEPDLIGMKCYELEYTNN